MKVCVWRTGHEIADTVAEAIYEGLKANTECRRFDTRTDIGQSIEEDVVIAYGILRGTSDVFKLARAMGKPWFNIDRGYWKPGHYDGYYRVSLGGTQQTTGLDKLEPDYERWDKLGLEILPPVRRSGWTMVCPPTEYVMQFFNYPSMSSLWPNELTYVRHKNCPTPIEDDLNEAVRVVTFNSSVGWEALRQGIPVSSDPDHSIVGAYMKGIDTMSQLDIDVRRRLFAIQASLQLTLEEIRSGLIWPLLEKLLTVSSVLTPEKQ